MFPAPPVGYLPVEFFGFLQHTILAIYWLEFAIRYFNPKIDSEIKNMANSHQSSAEYVIIR